MVTAQLTLWKGIKVDQMDKTGYDFWKHYGQAEFAQGVK